MVARLMRLRGSVSTSSAKFHEVQFRYAFNRRFGNHPEILCGSGSSSSKYSVDTQYRYVCSTVKVRTTCQPMSPGRRTFREKLRVNIFVMRRKMERIRIRYTPRSLGYISGAEVCLICSWIIYRKE